MMYNVGLPQEEAMSNDTIRVKLEGVDLEVVISIDKASNEKVLNIVNATFPGIKAKTRLAPEIVHETPPDSYVFSTKSIEGKTLKDVSRAKLEKVFREKPQVFTEADREFLTKLIKGE